MFDAHSHVTLTDGCQIDPFGSKLANQLHLHEIITTFQLMCQPCCSQDMLTRSSKLRTPCCWPCCTQRCTRPLPKALAAILQATNPELCCLRGHQGQAKPPAQGLCPSPTLQSFSSSMPSLLCILRSCFAPKLLHVLHRNFLSMCCPLCVLRRHALLGTMTVWCSCVDLMHHRGRGCPLAWRQNRIWDLPNVSL